MKALKNMCFKDCKFSPTTNIPFSLNNHSSFEKLEELEIQETSNQTEFLDVLLKCLPRLKVLNFLNPPSSDPPIPISISLDY